MTGSILEATPTFALDGLYPLPMKRLSKSSPAVIIKSFDVFFWLFFMVLLVGPTISYENIMKFIKL